MSNPWDRIDGPRKGSERAISQHKAISDGYEVAEVKSPVNLNQKHGRAKHCVEVPRFTKGCP